MGEIISFAELLKKKIPKIEYLVEGIIPKASLVYCFGAPGCFKTNFLLYTAIKGCEGKNIFEFKVENKFKTLWLDEENREIGMNDKISKILNGLDIDDIKNLENNNLIISNGFNILAEKSLKELEESIVKYKPDMIVIDSIAKVFPLSERDEKDVRKIYTVLNPLIRKYGVTFVLIHHARKKNFQQNGRDMEDISGSREFSAMADSMILLEELKEGTFLLKQVKNRYSAKNYAINFDVSDDENGISVVYTGRVIDKYIDKANRCKEDILTWMDKEKITEFQRKDILNIMLKKGHKTSAIDGALKTLRENELAYIYGKYSSKTEK
jgi:RecA-family ATPase